MPIPKAATSNHILFKSVSWVCLFCYIFGLIFQGSTHIHNTNVLFVDYNRVQSFS
ncbi:hypothetical protein BDV40DRAFT_252093 [Aspergillus tamarii]|uniref:Uncharacterized protein n=1 Tax=Aspergillus tamarii TaxID=41984 RepID=A0A5N6VA58_ASPTM|nr:hypothetical protein BDV40DRAFT_252093 [Aspergillus tamarii]